MSRRGMPISGSGTRTEYPAGYEAVPSLMRRTSLGYSPTLACVLLRDELRRFEEEDLHNERCVVETQPSLTSGEYSSRRPGRGPPA